MLTLRGNTEKLQVVTGAAGTINVDRDVMQASAAAPPVIQAFPSFGPMAVISSATTTDVVDATGLSAGVVYNVLACRVYNNSSTVSNTVTAQKTNGTNTAILAKVTLLPGERLELDETGSWRHFDSNGGEYPATLIIDPWNYDVPTGFVAQTCPRTLAGVNISALTSGSLYLQAIYLMAGEKISNISFCSGATQAGTPTNQFFALYDINRNLLAQTANATTTAWAANTFVTRALTATYTVPTTGLYYVGIMVTATTVPTLAGLTAAGNAALRTNAPIISGNGSTSLTTSLPNPSAAITAGVNTIWAGLS